MTERNSILHLRVTIDESLPRAIGHAHAIQQVMEIYNRELEGYDPQTRVKLIKHTTNFALENIVHYIENDII